MEAFDGYRAALSANRAQLFMEIPSGPFYGYNRLGAQPLEGVRLGSGGSELNCSKHNPRAEKRPH